MNLHEADRAMLARFASRGRGHRTTPERKARTFGAPHPTDPILAVPPSGALRRFRPPQMDQGAGEESTETCYGHATSVLIVAALAAAGTPLGWVPSPLGIARNALSEEQPLAVNALLEDIGADMGDVMTSIAREGVRPMGALAPGRYSDVTRANIVHRSTLADDEQSARELVLGPAQIQPSAHDFGPQLATSIALFECGNSIGIHASPAFGRWRAGDPALSDTSGFTATDGHDVANLDYRTNPATGELEFWLLSSWGEWGEEGGAWVTLSWLARGGCLEAWRQRVLTSATTQAAA